MSKGEFAAEHLSSLGGEIAGEELRDARRKYKVPEGMVIGSIEYQRWMAEQAILRNRLYQKRAYLKRRKITLALQQYSAKELTTVDEALAEVDAHLAEIKALRPVEVSRTRLKIREEGEKPPVEVGDEQKEEEEVKVDFIKEMAEIYNVPYEQAQRIMAAPDYAGHKTWEELTGRKHADALMEYLAKPKEDA